MAQDIMMFLVTLVAFAYLWSTIFLAPSSTLLLSDPDAFDPTSSAQAAAAAAPQSLLEQRIKPTSTKKSASRYSVDDEIQMACDEADCVRTCVHTSSSGERIVDPPCRRACGKARCKKRCKREPVVPYVERETKKEACIDACDRAGGPRKPACLEFCEDESKKCSDRCRERARRFFCVRDLDKLPQEEDFDPQKFDADSGPI